MHACMYVCVHTCPLGLRRSAAILASSGHACMHLRVCAHLPVGLVAVSGHLGEQKVGRDACGTRQASGDLGHTRSYLGHDLLPA